MSSRPHDPNRRRLLAGLAAAAVLPRAALGKAETEKWARVVRAAKIKED